MWLLHTEGVQDGDQKHGGFTVRITRDGVKVLAKQVQNLTPLMEEIGRYLVKVSQVAFANQRWDGKAWEPKQVPSVMGIVEDLSEGPSFDASRWDPKALINTGALRRSIRFTTSPKSVRMGSSLPYAERHHAGGLNILPITQTVRRNLATLIRANPSLRPALGFLFRKFEVEATVPARPFLGAPKSSKPRIEEITKRYFDEMIRV